MYRTIALTMIALAGPNGVRAETMYIGDVQIDVGSDQVVVTIPDVRVPIGMAYHDHGPDEHASFVWPTDSWVRGYRIDLVDSEGVTLPREMLHHVGVVQLDRRQLAYEKPLRVFAAGRETEPVMLPEEMGVRMTAGQPIVVYYAIMNPGGAEVGDVDLRITLTLSPNPNREPTEVVPLILNANPDRLGPSIFDVAPGLTATRSEFTLPVGGRVRVMGGHLHDHAVEIRLEDVLTGNVLVRLRTERDEDGTLRSVDTNRFLFTWGGLRLEARRPYRIVAIYDNPTGETIENGAMAYMAGPFVPDDMSIWPKIDRDDPVFQADLARLTGGSERAGDDHQQASNPRKGQDNHVSASYDY